MIGQSVAHYKITGKLGAGGMGEVYRATDTRLNRQVALKVLPQVFAQDEQRMGRFEREAQVLASLNHPNIASIYGLEETDGTKALVLELVEGETLQERIARGPIPVDEALKIALQICAGLEAAHENGIIHRDLKPANIKITPEGQVKILDFGLAKALKEERALEDISDSPTLSMAATLAGAILGTASYMSPEQARGKVVDRTCDHWSFGAILYEMLTGTKAFRGADITEVLASVVKVEIDWNKFSGATPRFLIRWLKRCLRADPNERLRNIADFRMAIEDYLVDQSSDSEDVAGFRPSPRWKTVIPWSIATAAASITLLLWILWRPMLPPEQPLVRFVHNLPSGQTLEPVDSTELVAVLSPDGSQLVYSATDSLGSTRLYRRPIDDFEATPIPGTEGARNPFYSPDGQWVGFHARGKLKKVAVMGGTPFDICDSESLYGASWGADETILFSPAFTSGLFRVSAAGGIRRPVTEPDPEKGELAHRWPEVLPDGKSVLFTVNTGMATDPRHAGILSLSTGQHSILLEDAANPRYVSSGHLIYLRAGSLYAAPFSLERLEVTGSATRVLSGIRFTGAGGAQYSFARNGTFAWIPAKGMTEPPSLDSSFRQVAKRSLAWVDRQGGRQLLPLPSTDYWAPSFSPDGKLVALTVGMDIYVLDPARDALTRLTVEGKNHIPIWTPDGKHLTYSSSRGGVGNLFMKAVDGTGVAERLLTSLQHQDPGSWDPEGRKLAYSQYHPVTEWDIMLLDRRQDLTPEPFLQTEFAEYHPMISPDGRWLAYTSDESGRPEVYVRSFPDSGSKLLISTDGGQEPVWARDGGELFFRNEGKLMVVEIGKGTSFAPGAPRLLLEVEYASREARGFGSPDYDVSPDGRFLMIKRDADPVLTEINLVLNWFEELKRLAPTE